jgi:hypothetical protein
MFFNIPNSPNHVLAFNRHYFNMTFLRHEPMTLHIQIQRIASTCCWDKIKFVVTINQNIPLADTSVPVVTIAYRIINRTRPSTVFVDIKMNRYFCALEALRFSVEWWSFHVSSIDRWRDMVKLILNYINRSISPSWDCSSAQIIYDNLTTLRPYVQHCSVFTVESSSGKLIQH